MSSQGLWARRVCLGVFRVPWLIGADRWCSSARNRGSVGSAGKRTWGRGGWVNLIPTSPLGSQPVQWRQFTGLTAWPSTPTAIVRALWSLRRQREDRWSSGDGGDIMPLRPFPYPFQIHVRSKELSLFHHKASTQRHWDIFSRRLRQIFYFFFDLNSFKILEKICCKIYVFFNYF